ncbi:E3 ubiquitin-protein ligase LRSAM1-like [Ostrinia furnacalis]|uniref:E3 ubiquitin-protein ligase LRSAM1-like n=1 Tax=Ostrinia furnacalis TaxID=93504 RepID=UPI00103D46BB|nr:E3 ubiquitin-protein ligase LRSAM1-like [Ostrinia furnacalis]
MGCAVSCVNQTTMLLFGKNSNTSDSRGKLERKLYIAKESPEPHFDLTDCELRQVPSGIFSICKVYRKEYLYLQGNRLHSLDEGGLLSDLYLIKVLNLSCNKFSKLPNDIKFLVNLTELHVHNNYLEFIPDNIEYLQNLKIIDISKNRLKKLTPALGKLKRLRKLNINKNEELNELCPELCLASNIVTIELDSDYFIFPPPHVICLGTPEIMKFLCKKLEVEYTPPLPMESDLTTIQVPSVTIDPFVKYSTATWEEQEAAIIEQENKFHEAAKQQRERFLSKVLQEQQELDSEIAKVHESKEIERQRLLKAIQKDEEEIECLVKNFIQSEFLKPEILQQQLAYEQSEHERLLEIARQNYDNIKKSDVLKAMEMLIEEDYTIQNSKKHYEDSQSNVKESLLLQDMEGTEKLQDLLKAKDQSRTALVEQLLEDQDVQKAAVASLIERVDAKSWSLNEEIALISSHLARLSTIEQEKKKLQINYNYNELMQQRVQMVTLLDDLLDQQTQRRKQLIVTVREMENETDAKSTDFWLKNYQKLMDSAPRTLLDVGKHLDPVLANYLLQEGVIHCLPFLVKFLFSEGSLLDIDDEKLKETGISLLVDREGILRAINEYVQAKNQNTNKYEKMNDVPDAPTPSAPLEPSVTEQNCSGVVTAGDSDDTTYESECVVCMDAKCEVVFVPCGHMCCCLLCSQKEIENCPLCRGDVERVIRVRLA